MIDMNGNGTLGDITARDGESGDRTNSPRRTQKAVPGTIKLKTGAMFIFPEGSSLSTELLSLRDTWAV